MIKKNLSSDDVPGTTSNHLLPHPGRHHGGEITVIGLIEGESISEGNSGKATQANGSNGLTLVLRTFYKVHLILTFTEIT